MLMTNLSSLLSTGTAASGAVSARRPLYPQVELPPEVEQPPQVETITYTRVAVPAPELPKVSWESGTAISPGTPEHCVQSFFDALAADKEEAMLGCIGSGDQFASARRDVLALVQLYKYRKQAGRALL